MATRNESLTVMFPPVDATYGAGLWADTNGYTALGTDSLLFDTRIDLSGWMKQDYTFGTVESQYQDPGIYTYVGASGKAEVMEIISDIPISTAELQIIRSNFGITVPGMMNSNQDFMSIIYGNYRLYVPNNSLGAFPGFLQLISSGAFGSKEPTASSTLYCYRIIRCAGVAGETLATPACRIGLFGAFYEEADLPHLMRLRRSYNLQQGS